MVEKKKNKEMKIGYVRVSTIEDRQKLGFEAQKRILRDNRVDVIYSEK